MKKFTLFCVAVAAAMGANAQTMIDWNDEGTFSFYAEDFVAEGSISWSEDDAAFVCNGKGEGKILLNLKGKTIDFSEVASIEVKGSWEASDTTVNFAPGAWDGRDPLASILINDAITGKINEWMGSRYSINYTANADKGDHAGEPYYSLSTKIDSLYFKARTITEGEGEAAVVTGSVPGLIMIDEVVLTKIKEQDPKAIAPLFHKWTNWDKTGEIDESFTGSFDDNVGKNQGTGGVIVGSGSVLGSDYADLTGYAGIYAKGTPGVSLRMLFNRPTMGGGQAVCTECNPTFDENGEIFFLFDKDLFTKDTKKWDGEDGLPADPEEWVPFSELFDYVHLNAVKFPWNFPEGVEQAKVSKFNFIEKGEDSVNEIESVMTDGAIFNVFGQRVDDKYRGIVIKNGKKFISK